ncbi:sensor histidine kinase [Agromyces sp. NPDC056523]|uniref:sensor histidine kinase n=1 Tax=Agromyces sp. NPDC056523 TaxID=3345850 RepID=UPI0036726010
MTGGQSALLASQVVVVAVGLLGATLVIAAVASERGAPRNRRAWLPAVAVVAILLGSSVAAAFPAATIASAVWFGAFPLLAATYPDGRFVPRWFIAPVVVLIACMAAVFATGGAIRDEPWWILVGPSGLLFVLGQVYRYRYRSDTRQRESVRWALLGILTSAELFVLVLILEGGTIGVRGPGFEAAANLAVVPALLGFVIGLVRPRLWNVDPPLQALLAFTMATPVLAAAYWAASSVGAPGTAAAGWIGAAAVAVLAVPVIRAATGVAARVVYRGRVDPAAAVDALGRAVAVEPDAVRVPEAILRSVVHSLFLDGAALRGAEVSAQVGVIEGRFEEFPVVHLGEVLARLRIPPRPGESELTARDRMVAEALALHAGPALHGVRALARLTESHALLVAAREEERRRLRRDLHDDLSPSLAGIALSAAALARRLARTGGDPQLASIADELHRDIRSVIARAREISHDLRPAVLDEQGLVAAIRSRVTAPRPDELEIRIDADDERMALPAAVDVAALRIVQEAVSNVRRHAAATTCTVSLQLDADHLDVTVHDDGIGIPELVSDGLGIPSIRERARELGGIAEIGRDPAGGSRVHVRLPLEWGAT